MERFICSKCGYLDNDDVSSHEKCISCGGIAHHLTDFAYKLIRDKDLTIKRLNGNLMALSLDVTDLQSELGISRKEVKEVRIQQLRVVKG